MRRALPMALLVSLFLPALCQAAESFEALVHKLEGTIMVDRPKDGGGKETFALGSDSAVRKGDTLTAYDKSWLILKSPKGDLIGLEGDTVLTFDEMYKGGPDRQVRILLQRGKVLVKAKKSGSRQSFFEIHAGNMVSLLGKVNMAVDFSPARESMEVQFFGGKLKVIDNAGEQTFLMESRRTWEKGQLTQEDPLPLADGALLHFKNFFNGKVRF